MMAVGRLLCFCAIFTVALSSNCCANKFKCDATPMNCVGDSILCDESLGDCTVQCESNPTNPWPLYDTCNYQGAGCCSSVVHCPTDLECRVSCDFNCNGIVIYGNHSTLLEITGCDNGRCEGMTIFCPQRYHGKCRLYQDSVFSELNGLTIHTYNGFDSLVYNGVPRNSFMHCYNPPSFMCQMDDDADFHRCKNGGMLPCDAPMPTIPPPSSTTTSAAPTHQPSTASPTRTPTKTPVVIITSAPTPKPTNTPTAFPTLPTKAPTFPTNAPTRKPTYHQFTPTTEMPTTDPTYVPTDTPTFTDSPTRAPDTKPTIAPTPSPTVSPTQSPTNYPTDSPTHSPTNSPSPAPTTSPAQSPTNAPTTTPTTSPTNAPTFSPTASPTRSPTSSPTFSPTNAPTVSPTVSPSNSPTSAPTAAPTYSPTGAPTISPTRNPTDDPTADPTTDPTQNPTPPTLPPTTDPTQDPTTFWPTTEAPTMDPTLDPTTQMPTTFLPTPFLLSPIDATAVIVNAAEVHHSAVTQDFAAVAGAVMADIVVISCCVAIIVVAFKKYKKRELSMTIDASTNIMSQEFDTTDNENEEAETDTDCEPLQTDDVSDCEPLHTVRSPIALPSEGDADTEKMPIFKDESQRHVRSSNLLELTPMLQVICDSEDDGAIRKSENRKLKDSKRDRTQRRNRNRHKNRQSTPKLSANLQSSQHKNTLSMMSDLINGKSVDVQSVDATAGSPSSRRKLRMESVNISIIDHLSCDDMDSDLEHDDDDDNDEGDAKDISLEEADENDLDMAVEHEDDENVTLKSTPKTTLSGSYAGAFMKRLRGRGMYKRRAGSDIHNQSADTVSAASRRSVIPSIDPDVITSIHVIHEENT